MSVTPLNAAALGVCFLLSLGFFVCAALRIPVKFHKTPLSSGSLLILSLLVNWMAWTATALTVPESKLLPPWVAALVLTVLGLSYLFSLRADRKEANQPTDPPGESEQPSETRRAA